MADRGEHAGEPDRYRTVGDGPEVETREKGSRFLARAFHARSEPAARGLLAEVRRLHHDATHHCHALRIGPPGRVLERSDDDGEPSGTAGAPILAALAGTGLHDALVVVTRHFGGTKLGTGGLARAYGDAARAALAAAPARSVVRLAVLEVACSYDDLGAVEAVLAREAASGVAAERAFGDSPRLAVSVPASRADAVARALADATGGRATVRRAAGAARVE